MIVRGYRRYDVQQNPTQTAPAAPHRGMRQHITSIFCFPCQLVARWVPCPSLGTTAALVIIPVTELILAMRRP